MSESTIDILTARVKAFFVEHDRIPKFVFVGVDAFKDIIEWHQTERVFYNNATVQTAFGERQGIFAKVMGFSVLVIPLGKLSLDRVMEPEQVLIT